MTRKRVSKPIRPIYDSDLASLFDLVVYDELEAEPDDDERGFIDWVFRKVARRQVRDILDAGCGTGRFLIPLVRDGYRVTGLDRGVGMIRETRRRLKSHGLKAPLLQKNVAALDADRAFDAIIGMDSILCYILETDRVLNVLRRFRRALRPGGVVVLNNANVLARLQEGLNSDVQVSRGPGVTVRHRENNWYDPLHSVFHIRIEGSVTRGKIRRDFQHHEIVRVFTPEEMKTYLTMAGFEAPAVYPTFDPENMDDVEEEYLTYVALRPGGSRR